jgi:hypothetical protein
MQQVQMIAPQKTVISKLLTDETPLCITDQVRVLKAFAYIVKVYFGLNTDTVSDEVYELAFKQIKDKYPNLTFEQLNLSYSETTFEKKQGVSLTVTELMQPVALFWVKTQFILHQADKIKLEMNEEAEKESKRQAHYDESVKLYIECVNSDKVWKGTAFQAMVFAKESFAHRFTQPEKDRIYSDAKQLVKELNAKRTYSEQEGVAFLEPVPNDVQMFSQLIVTEACRRGLEIIVG